MSFIGSRKTQIEPVRARGKPVKRDSQGGGYENAAEGRKDIDEGMRFVVYGSQMNLHALERARWTLLDLDFDFQEGKAYFNCYLYYSQVKYTAL